MKFRKRKKASLVYDAIERQMSFAVLSVAVLYLFYRQEEA